MFYVVEFGESEGTRTVLSENREQILRSKAALFQVGDEKLDVVLESIGLPIEEDVSSALGSDGEFEHLAFGSDFELEGIDGGKLFCMPAPLKECRGTPRSWEHGSMHI